MADVLFWPTAALFLMTCRKIGFIQHEIIWNPFANYLLVRKALIITATSIPSCNTAPGRGGIYPKAAKIIPKILRQIPHIILCLAIWIVLRAIWIVSVT